MLIETVQQLWYTVLVTVMNFSVTGATFVLH